MTQLEKDIVESIKQTGDIWGAIEIVQKYPNYQFYDRVLDNILKWGKEGIVEKPNRIFYGDNTHINELEEGLVAEAEKPHKFEGTGIGDEYDKVLEIAANFCDSMFNDYLKAKQNRKPEVSIQIVTVPTANLAAFKPMSRTDAFRKAIELLNIKTDEDAQLYECDGKLFQLKQTTMTIYTIR